MSRLATIRDGLLLALLGLFGALLLMQLGLVRMSPARFTWSFLPLPSLILSGIAGALLAAAAVLVFMPGTSRVTTVTAVLSFVSAPVLLAGSGMTSASFAAVGPAILALEIAALVAAMRSGRKRAVIIPWALTIITGFALFVTALAVYAMGIGSWAEDMAEETVIIDARSPDGLWTMTGIERNEGAFGGSTSIEVHRSWLGLLETSRSVYFGEWGSSPAARWVDWHTIAINGQEFDLYWGYAPE